MTLNSYCTIKTTCNSKRQAKTIATVLLCDKLIFCAQLSKVESLYFWNGKIKNDREILLSVKAKSEDYKKIEEIIIKNHSYEIPQIVQIPIENGFQDYFNWAKNVTES